MTVKELASYYRAAVEYIDPRLREDCPVEDIRAAANARQHALRAHDSETARLEHDKIEEALQFIQRVHPELYSAPDVCSLPGTVENAAMVQGWQETVQHSGNGQTDPSPQLPVEAAELPEIAGLLPVPDSAAVDPGDAGTETHTEALSEPVVTLDPALPTLEPASAPVETAKNGNGEHAAVNHQPAGKQMVNAMPAEGPALPDDDAQSGALQSHPGPHGSAKAGPGRQQFIEELRARRECPGELDEQEARQLITDLKEEQHSEERARAIIESVPDVQHALDAELQREEAGTRPLDFRSMMEQAGADRTLPVRPVRPRRLRTAEILHRESQPQTIPEEHAAPVLLGILLILWQFCAALLAGFALTRLLVWPFGTAFSTMSPFRAMLACLVGVASAALLGAWFRHYRLRSHRLSLPVHVSAVSMLILLLTWQLKAAANGYASAPPLWLWCLLLAVWLVATVAAGLHDLRVPPVRSADGESVVSGKHVEPLAH